MNIDTLKGIAVVSLAERAKLGRVESHLFDPATLQLRAPQPDRFHLEQEMVSPLPQLGTKGAYLPQMMQDKCSAHNQSRFSLVENTAMFIQVVEGWGVAAFYTVGMLHNKEDY